MKKILYLFLIGIILFSGCISKTGPTGQIIVNPELKYIEHDGSCRRDIDCSIAYCANSLERHCMNSIQIETKIKCNETNLLLYKDYDICACINNKCSLIQ
ncbi:MAG: hypothetical protein J7K26_03155 [Candidatus Aenigmarchaeota archaeon]|nr:hypothetical protein [Candidatus Aenigmarchaeota archaeon]